MPQLATTGLAIYCNGKLFAGLERLYLTFSGDNFRRLSVTPFCNVHSRIIQLRAQILSRDGVTSLDQCGEVSSPGMLTTYWIWSSRNNLFVLVRSARNGDFGVYQKTI